MFKSLSLISKLHTISMWLKTKKKLFILSFLLGIVFLIIPQTTHAILGADTLADTVVIGIILIGPLIFQVVAYVFALISGIIFQAIITTLVNNPPIASIVRDPVLLNAWVTVRNLANMLIVLAVIGIAIATILRFKDYEAKKLLLPILVVALLINFTPVFVGVVIDASNVMIRTFLDPIAGRASQTVSAIRTLDTTITNDAWQVLWDKTGSAWSWSELFIESFSVAAIMIEFGVIYITFSIALIFFVILFISRYAVLSLLFILSPLAFVFRVLPIPAAKKLWDDWWQHFIKWSFMGLGMAFCTWLAFEIMREIGATTALTAAGGATAGTFMSQAVKLFIVAFIMIAGLKITVKSGLPFAGAVMGLATSGFTGAANLVKSGYKKTGGWVADNTGVTRAKNAMQYYGTRAGETMRLVGRGTAAANWKTRQSSELDEKKRTERASALSGDEQVAELRGGGISIRGKKIISGTREGNLDRAAMFKALYKKGQLYKLDRPGELEKEVKNATSLGMSMSDIKKEDYRAAGFDKDTLKRIADRRGWAVTDPRTKQAAVQQQLEENLSSMSSDQRRNITVEDLTPELVASRSFTVNMVRDFATADDAHIDALNGPGLKAVRIRNNLRAEIKAAKSTKNKAEENRLKNILREIKKLPV